MAMSKMERGDRAQDRRDARQKAEARRCVVECEVRDCGAKKLPGLRVCQFHARGMAAASEGAR